MQSRQFNITYGVRKRRQITGVTVKDGHLSNKNNGVQQDGKIYTHRFINGGF